MADQRERRWPFYAAFISSGACISLVMWILTQAFDWWHWRGQINGNLISINRALEDSLVKQDIILEQLHDIEIEIRAHDNDDDHHRPLPQMP